MQGKKADIIIMDELTDYPPVRHDDVVDACTYMSFDTGNEQDHAAFSTFTKSNGVLCHTGTVTGRMSGGPAIQQLSSQKAQDIVEQYRKAWSLMFSGSSAWPKFWSYVFKQYKTELRVSEDGTTHFNCGQSSKYRYHHKFKQKWYVPPKYEDAVLLLDAAESEGDASIAGVGKLTVKKIAATATVNGTHTIIPNKYKLLRVYEFDF